MIIPRREEIRGVQGIEKGTLRDTKKAVVFATLGLPLDPATGIFVTKEPGQEWLDGIAHFPFIVKAEKFDQLNRIYDDGTADTRLDAVLDELKTSHDPRVSETAYKIEKLLIDALFVWGRRFLENYQHALVVIKSKAPHLEVIEKRGGAFELKFGRNHK